MENLILLLEKLLIVQAKPERSKLIKTFQNIVWNDNIFDEKNPSTDIFDELACDFEFYEVDPERYGEERFQKEIKQSLKNIKNLRSSKF